MSLEETIKSFEQQGAELLKTEKGKTDGQKLLQVSMWLKELDAWRKIATSLLAANSQI